MGKPTGFMDYKRQELALRPPQERIKDWEEIKTSSLPHKEELQKQAARCMDCGIPFCHSGVMLGKALSGCPLHNLMPEFNDFVYQGLDHFAYARLNKTNNFPEFTSHVCPAPCEGACSASLASSAVSIRNLEQYIIETAFAEGYVKPNLPAIRSGKKVAVIGSGPAGLACADQLNKARHSVTVNERADRAGGLLMYGIPNMKLDKQLVERRIKLLESAGVKFELNSEIGHKVSSEMLLKQFDAIALCTGSTVPRDLPVPGRELQGIYFAKDYLHSVTKSLLDSQFKDKKAISAKGKDVIVIGGGGTGTAVVASGEHADLAAEVMAYIKLSAEASKEIWNVLGFDPVNTEVWTDTALTQNPDNQFVQYFTTYPFDVLNEVKDSIGLLTCFTDEKMPSINNEFCNVTLNSIYEDGMDIKEALTQSQETLDNEFR